MEMVEPDRLSQSFLRRDSLPVRSLGEVQWTMANARNYIVRQSISPSQNRPFPAFSSTFDHQMRNATISSSRA